MIDEYDLSENNEKVKVRMTRKQYDEIKRQLREDKENPKKQKSFNSFFNFQKRQTMNNSLKRPDEILVFLLNLKRQIEGPILTKIYGGNFLVIRNHVYRFNPHRVFSFGKYKSVIAREFDRELVGIEDYQQLVLEDRTSKNPGQRTNIDDPVLIKALIQAKLAEKPSMKGGMKWIIIALIVIGVIVGFFLLTSKKTPAQTPVPPINTTAH